jgi:hypothetical protein
MKCAALGMGGNHVAEFLDARLPNRKQNNLVSRNKMEYKALVAVYVVQNI